MVVGGVVVVGVEVDCEEADGVVYDECCCSSSSRRRTGGGADF